MDHRARDWGVDQFIMMGQLGLWTLEAVIPPSWQTRKQETGSEAKLSCNPQPPPPTSHPHGLTNSQNSNSVWGLGVQCAGTSQMESIGRETNTSGPACSCRPVLAPSLLPARLASHSKPLCLNLPLSLFLLSHVTPSRLVGFQLLDLGQPPHYLESLQVPSLFLTVNQRASGILGGMWRGVGNPSEQPRKHSETGKELLALPPAHTQEGDQELRCSQ